MSTYDRDPIDVAKDAIAFGEKQVKEWRGELEKSQRQVIADETQLSIAEGYVNRWTKALDALQTYVPAVGE